MQCSAAPSCVESSPSHRRRDAAPTAPYDVIPARRAAVTLSGHGVSVHCTSISCQHVAPWDVVIQHSTGQILGGTHGQGHSANIRQMARNGAERHGSVVSHTGAQVYRWYLPPIKLSSCHLSNINITQTEEQQFGSPDSYDHYGLITFFHGPFLVFYIVALF